jgi:predicted ATP-dependent endonuclease of OLD family
MMNYIINKWYLGHNDAESELKAFKLLPHKDWLENLSKVNIFIGQNNSGKSRFLRNLVALSREYISPIYCNLDSTSKIPGEIKTIIKDTFEKYRLNEYKLLFPKIFEPEYKIDPFIISGIRKQVDVKTLINPVNEILNSSYTNRFDKLSDRSVTARGSIQMRVGEISERLISLIEKLKREYESVPEKLDFYKIYIPVLRGLRGLTGNDDYFNQIKHDYFNKIDHDHFLIFTGLQMYDSVLKYKNGSFSDRKLIEEYERLLSDRFFEGKGIELISNVNEKVLYVKIGQEKEFPIFELGDGIQHIIILTYPLYINRDRNVLAFIEEPELYLHPGLQRKLIELLASDTFGNLQTFITTHSNHFLDLMLDFDQISIYKFKKQLTDSNDNESLAQFTIENACNEDMNILKDLGVRNSSVFLSNCTIWVEGITDRMYIRKYLDLYMSQDDKKKYEEDKHYSFLEYSGSNLSHWDFEGDEGGTKAKRICNSIMLIVDKDEKKESKHKKYAAILEGSYFPLNCREIENTLSPSIIIKIIQEFEDEAVELNTQFTFEKYKEEYLGSFIENSVLKDKKGSKRNRGVKEDAEVHPYSSESGTIKNKVNFAEKAIFHINSFDDLTDEAKRLTKAIYDFIGKSNSD